MIRALAILAAFALLVYALADFAGTDERERGGIPGWLWVLIIVPLVYFGPLSWIVFSRSHRNAARTQGSHPSAGGPARPRRRPGQPIAPDDDPDFLWRLAQEQRRAARNDSGSTSPRPDDEAKPSAADPDDPPDSDSSGD